MSNPMNAEAVKYYCPFCSKEILPEEVLFADEDTLKQYRLQLPRVVKLQKRLEKQMETAFSKICLTEEELAKEVARSIKGREQA